jgi:hypothetical protein
MRSKEFDNCKANSELFNNYFLTIAEKITYNICNNIKLTPITLKIIIIII